MLPNTLNITDKKTLSIAEQTLVQVSFRLENGKVIFTQSMWSRVSLEELRSAQEEKMKVTKGHHTQRASTKLDTGPAPTLIFTSLGASFFTSVNSLSPNPTNKRNVFSFTHLRNKRSYSAESS